MKRSKALHIIRLQPSLLVMAVLVVPMLALLQSCNTSGCTDNHSALPLAGFYAAGTDNQISISGLAMGGVKAPGDSLLISPKQSKKQVYLPFRFEKESTAFFIHYDYPELGLDNPAFNDTITFYYTSTPTFASEECGAFFTYNITKVKFTRHVIEDVVVTDSVISNVEAERIHIYFRVAEITPAPGGDGGGEADKPSEGDDNPSDNDNPTGDDDVVVVTPDNGEEGGEAK